jgi:hypothetical protein
MEALLPLQEADRKELIEKCSDQKWCTRDLRRAIDGYRTRRKQGGRTFQKPADLPTALRQLIDESRQWDRRYHEAWFQADDPAIDADAGTNSTTCELASEAIEMLESLRADIDMCLRASVSFANGTWIFVNRFSRSSFSACRGCSKA